ncbi:MAG: hypothetical protein JW795_08795, partial [Chitinivibrionales bacterium]|nr:hypothetical protein [Chitinivibrionales bacterium]
MKILSPAMLAILIMLLPCVLSLAETAEESAVALISEKVTQKLRSINEYYFQHKDEVARQLKKKGVELTLLAHEHASALEDIQTGDIERAIEKTKKLCIALELTPVDFDISAVRGHSARAREKKKNNRFPYK